MQAAIKALLFAISNADFFSTTIIFILIGLSIYSFHLMLSKYFRLRDATTVNDDFREDFLRCGNVLDIALRLEKYEGSPLHVIYKSGMSEIMDTMMVDQCDIDKYCRNRTLPRKLEEYEIEKVRNTMERVVSDEIVELEDKINNISTIVTLSPFLGLLGTVIGITITLCSAAMNGGRMDFGVVGPGICGALLTTIAGLVVAIPALVGGNYLIGMVRSITVKMDSFVEDFTASLKIQNELQGNRNFVAQPVQNTSQTNQAQQQYVQNIQQTPEVVAHQQAQSSFVQQNNNQGRTLFEQ